MNWVDLIILIILVFFALHGLRRGFLIQLLDIVGFAAALLFSFLFYSFAAQLFIKLFSLPPIVANPIGFLLVWIITESIFFSLITRLISPLVQKAKNTLVNKYLGFLPSTINALLFMSFILLFVVSIPINPIIKRDIYISKIGSFLVTKATVLEAPLNSVFGPITKQGLTFLTVKPEAKEIIPLEFTQKEQTVDYESEKKMLDLVNGERAKLGIAPLTWREDLAEVGRAHSRDMFTRGYFSHYSPEEEDVGNRLASAEIIYSYAGENLALAPTLDRAHTGLINSEGHRRNILDPAFKQIGIGAIDGGVYGKMFTQVFLGN